MSAMKRLTDEQVSMLLSDSRPSMPAWIPREYGARFDADRVNLTATGAWASGENEDWPDAVLYALEQARLA